MSLQIDVLYTTNMYETLPQANRVEEFRAVIRQGSEPLVTIPSCNKEYIAGSRITADSCELTDAHRARLTKTFERMVEPIRAKPLLLSGEQQAAIEGIRDFHVKWVATTYGVDISSRSPNFRKIHFYSPEEYARGDFRKGSGGTFRSRSGEIYIRQDRNTVYNFNHELSHCLSDQLLWIEAYSDERGIFYHQSVGYGFVDMDDRWKMFDEYLVETQNNLSLQALAKETKTNHYAEAEVNYSYFCLYFDVLMVDLSQQLELPIDLVLTYFVRCHLLGDTSCLEIFNVVYGEGSSDLISKTGDKVYCKKLGLSSETVKERSEQYDDGKPVPMVSWGGYEIQMPPD